MSRLFSPWHLRGIELRNRIVVSPMCQYMAQDGVAGEWHRVHLGSRAVGGAGMVIVEATAVSPEGRISPGDLGLWNEAQEAALRPIVAFMRSQGAVSGLQIAHAGRKASTAPPFLGGRFLTPAEGGWPLLAPSAVAFGENGVPREMEESDIARVRDSFVSAARRAISAGFDYLELHMAHGYLLHSFLSPLSNRRTDSYGGSLDARMRFPLEVAHAVRKVWPEDRPLGVRISAVDWVDGGWDLESSLALSRKLRDLGVDLVDCSSGGIVSHAFIPVGPGYQTAFSERIRQEVGVATLAVGMITDPAQAEHILVTGQADGVALAREMLRDPYWPLHAADRLGVQCPWPAPYARAKS
ncbi:MAG: NADH:flavin oxidoreductase/NADH oxidase [Leptospirillia bacterium]